MEKTGRTGPVEKDHYLSDCPFQAAGGGKSLSLQLSSGRLDGLCLPQPGIKEPSQAAVRLVASIVFISFGVIAAFCCAIVDGVFAARHIDLRPLYAGRCQYYSKSTTPPEVQCEQTDEVPGLQPAQATVEL
ncbi:hypothetical protein IHE44_0003194 [Lamprotornis superbus]|uniref:Transmembrane protein 255A n=1 Tax=Lamprotornis superbus TaxID=245042 RepID=A0A835TTU4_9PASS|nr:hypothetical protein IHE44_0003194 [Lamprotornis superbus]